MTTMVKPRPRTKRPRRKRKGKMVAGFEASDAISAIQKWAMEEGNEDFDTSFVDDLSEKLEEYGELTERQEQALENIVNRFEIDVETYS